MTINFKPTEQAIIDMLTPTLPIFKANGMTASDVRKMYDAQITGVEKSAKCRIEIIDKDGAFSIEMLDIGSDFVRSRPTKTGLNLRAKKQSVPIVVTVTQPDKDLLLSNKQIAAGLLELSEYVAAMPVEIHVANKTDWPIELGGYPKGSEGNFEDDDDDDGDAEGDTPSIPANTAAVTQELTDESPLVPTESIGNELPGEDLTLTESTNDIVDNASQEDSAGSLDLMNSNV